MARRRRKLPPLFPDETREFSHACKGWVKIHGKHYRDLQACGRAILAGRRDGRKMSSAVSFCRSVMRDLDAREGYAAGGMQTIANCVGRGFSHGITQPRRR
jgi:hypothetical protein